MRILTCPAHLQRLEAALRSSLPRALPVSHPRLPLHQPTAGVSGHPIPSPAPP